MKRKKLDRRRFLKTGSVGLTGLALLPKLSLVTNAQRLPSSSLRRTYALNHNWLYSDKVSPNAQQPGFNDAAFGRVTIPHTNKFVPVQGLEYRD